MSKTCAFARATTLCAAALLGGCATVSQDAVPTGTAAAAYQNNIEIDGRISVQYEQDQRPQSLHGSFFWKQTAQELNLEMFSPLGQTVATINVKPGIATLVQSGRAPQVAADVDALAAQSLGWPLPVSGMRQWLQGSGVDASGRPFVAKAGEDDTSYSTRDGWRVTYANWETDAASGQTRPKRIDLSRNTSQAGKVSIRIAIDGWKQP
ncbi:lipoprotein insertase outer membrane protein LolB [Herbaspirillum rubrisubalbicans]|uniref:Outer-membrane lipoprotein LolB n=1 Tax=Herbaspirillum rubrisubalbicans TaxID=80842 RepID=A0AAD0UCQ6_9BURK|nr:lipoprotein insertase outer membrane protein LolB [Herbaspirillum rubrisubalbicans]AYR26067.1 outer membrane lipoprotein LolB [Herbaspirillum rubrisubalbicans]